LVAALNAQRYALLRGCNRELCIDARPKMMLGWHAALNVAMNRRPGKSQNRRMGSDGHEDTRRRRASPQAI
jgi:hypothetical protein